jgi:hypothetical protein
VLQLRAFYGGIWTLVWTRDMGLEGRRDGVNGKRLKREFGFIEDGLEAVVGLDEYALMVWIDLWRVWDVKL